MIARYIEDDPHRARLAEVLASEQRAHRFTYWYTVEGAVSEAYTFLRRHSGLAPGQDLLADLRRTGTPKVLSVPWTLPASFLQSDAAEKAGKGFSFTDATLVVAARQLGAEHILTVDPSDFRPFGLTPLP